MQFFKPENYFLVREALLQAGRRDLIGSGCDGLNPATPPREAREARRRAANRAASEKVEGDHYHAVANPARGESPAERGPAAGRGYRPGRKTQQRRQGKRKP